MSTDGAARRVLDIEGNLRQYLADRDDPTGRYASFDYCFNYFQEQRETSGVTSLVESDQLQTSCLQLGFYLASWGMFRGSAELLSRSAKCFVPVLEAIVDAPPEVWKIDAGAYSPEAIDTLLGVGRTIGRVLPGGQSPTLVTKTMLGVFGCVPAFDNYFRKGFGVWSFGRKALGMINAFYERHGEVIERHRVPTWDFEKARLSERRYTRAKVIDMIFFIEGARS